MNGILYVSDLDGTLLDSTGAVSDESAKIINALIEDGLAFTVATARSFCTAKPCIANLRLKLPMILQNGAVFASSDGNERTYNAFTQKEVCFLTEFCRVHQLSPIVYSVIDGSERASWLLKNQTDGILRYANARRGDPRLRVCTSEAELFAGEVFYLTVIGSRSGLSVAHTALRAAGSFTLVFDAEANNDAYWLEIMPLTSTKAAGVQRIRAEYGFQRAVCFGDAVNDLPMFAACDEAYAVLNASETVKKAASGVIGANSDDAVARFLQNKHQKN